MRAGPRPAQLPWAWGAPQQSPTIYMHPMSETNCGIDSPWVSGKGLHSGHVGAHLQWETCEFQSCLGYRVISCLKNKTRKTSPKMSTGWRTAGYELTGILKKTEKTQGGRIQGQRLGSAQRRARLEFTTPSPLNEAGPGLTTSGSQ